MRFAKYHGAGNDFVLVDLRDRPRGLSPDVVRRICDRHTGVGADGVLGLTRGAPGTGVDPHMRVMNADGSIGDMCGNGLRCFVAWLIDDLGAPRAPFTVASDAGPQPSVPFSQSGRVVEVEVQLNAPTFEPQDAVEVLGRTFTGTPARVGNPHFVMVRPADADEVTRCGYALSTHPRFPRGANIEWLTPTGPASGDLTVWERGCGLTQACGTGGGAAASVGVALGLFPAGEPIALRLPGGVLTYTLSSDHACLTMRGPVVHVFTGVLPPALLAE